MTNKKSDDIDKNIKTLNQRDDYLDKRAAKMRENLKKRKKPVQKHQQD